MKQQLLSRSVATTIYSYAPIKQSIFNLINLKVGIVY